MDEQIDVEINEQVANLDYIIVKGARENNLKDIDVTIPRNKLVVITGVSGSGKSSLAFSTIYSEGQRRYLESLSAYARQFLNLQNKPLVTSITGLSPAIAIDQKTRSKNPRSTVGTVTEINDYLRLMYARIGMPYSPVTGKIIKSQTISEMLDIIFDIPENSKIEILAPIAKKKKGEFQKELEQIKRQGFEKVIIDNEIVNLSNEIVTLQKTVPHNISVIIDNVKVTQTNYNRILDALEASLKMAEGITEVKIIEIPKDSEHKAKNPDVQEGKTIMLSQRYSCPESGFQIPNIEPRLFSFNNPLGACDTCQGLGEISSFSTDLIVPNTLLSINEGAIKLWDIEHSQFVKQTLESLAKHYKFSLDVPFGALSQSIKDMLFYGSNDEVSFYYGDRIRQEVIKQPFKGIIRDLTEKLDKFSRTHLEEIMQYQSVKPCNKCIGYRLKKEVLCIKVNSLHIGELLDMDITSAYSWVDNLPNHLSEKENIIASQIIKEIKSRLSFLDNVGLNYLTLSRKAATLSGGESQRIRLASQIGSGLHGVMYVLDEPSIGLHQRDNQRLINALLYLKKLGNTVIVVEHDADTIMAADYVIDIGPGAGTDGGMVLAAGSPKEIIENPKSVTGEYLSGRKKITERPNKTDFTHYLELNGVVTNNLKNVNIKIPIESLTLVTGVSGSGKSSLILDTLYPAVQKKLDPNNKLPQGKFTSLKGTEHFSRLIEIDQSPIGKTPRSNPATYVGLFTLIRDIFANLPQSKVRGYKLGRFSFNVKGGRCEACSGDGLIKMEMHFLHDVYVKCEICEGKRYNRETLEIKYKNKSISDVLNLTVNESLDFFKNVPHIFDKIKVLHDVGLGYLRLGQSATTLSGGEAQRIKLAKELSKRSFGKTLYILDEPTTGLHFADIDKMLKILYALVDLGNTVIVIEHNLDVIKRADYIIDVGIEGGNAGGNIIAQGTIDQIIKEENSITGKFIQQAL
jgi:excinuclease ABC subunit A